eukprot:63408-Chlamydomonas_euryale.AAC.1
MQQSRCCTYQPAAAARGGRGARGWRDGRNGRGARGWRDGRDGRGARGWRDGRGRRECDKGSVVLLQ